MGDFPDFLDFFFIIVSQSNRYFRSILFFSWCLLVTDLFLVTFFFPVTDLFLGVFPCRLFFFLAKNQNPLKLNGIFLAIPLTEFFLAKCTTEIFLAKCT